MLEPTGRCTRSSRTGLRRRIAEQHAVTSAAGLAMGCVHPVVCLYATFLNRAFDQLLMDVALHSCPVTFVLDRAGLTGEDGPSHNGMWDLSIPAGDARSADRRAPCRRDPAPGTAGGGGRDGRPDGGSLPKGTPSADLPVVSQVDGLDELRAGDPEDVLLVCVGALAGLGQGPVTKLDTHRI